MQRHSNNYLKSISHVIYISETLLNSKVRGMFLQWEESTELIPASECSESKQKSNLKKNYFGKIKTLEKLLKKVFTVYFVTSRLCQALRASSDEGNPVR